MTPIVYIHSPIRQWRRLAVMLISTILLCDVLILLLLILFLYMFNNFCYMYMDCVSAIKIYYYYYYLYLLTKCVLKKSFTKRSELIITTVK